MKLREIVVKHMVNDVHSRNPDMLRNGKAGISSELFDSFVHQNCKSARD
jgi:hypothetical protein